MVNFIKVLEYDLKPDDPQVFEYLSSITSQEYDPPSLRAKELYFDSGIVFYSPLRRSIETVSTSSNVISKSLDSLKEIPFILPKLCTKEEWSEQKSLIVRKRFKEYLIQDKLPISREKLWLEIEDIIKICLEAEEKFNCVNVVSHSFRMKLIEAYIKTKGGIVTKPELVHDYIIDNQKTYDFGTGFSA